MGSLQSELVRHELANQDQYAFDINVQSEPSELQVALRRLKELKGKFHLMRPTQRLLLALRYSEAGTVSSKVAAVNATCDYLDTL